MIPSKICNLTLVVLVFSFLIGTAVAFILNNDFGNLDVKTIVIQDDDHQISGLLYRPLSTTANNPLPAVILVHGISSSKESMSGIALELARRGFVALTIDVVGHGDSGGQLDATGDLSLGTLAALRYIETLPYVDISSLGLVGHSLGAGAIRSATASRGDIRATVFIAGGLGEMSSDQSVYGILNRTFPSNLLVAIGKQDALFDLSQITREWLPQVFGVTEEVAPGQLYGDFTSGTARKLITPVTTHLLEPLDPAIVSETVTWLINALKLGGKNKDRLEGILIYLLRDAMMLLSTFSLVGLVFPISYYVLPRESASNYGGFEFVADWKITVIWGILSMGLFLPMLFFGLKVPFPPVLFGASIAWWLLMVAVAGFLFTLFVLPKVSGIKLRMGTLISKSFTWQGVLIAIGLFVFLYFVIFLIDISLSMKLWIFVPIFRAFHSIRRFIAFFMFTPFFLVFFFVEGIYLHILRRQRREEGLILKALAMGKTIGIKVAPYLAVMGVQYVPMFLMEVKLLPSFFGFLIEFFPLMTLQFAISAACSWWFHRITSKIGTGAIFNALLFSWISACTFPFGVLHY